MGISTLIVLQYNDILEIEKPEAFLNSPFGKFNRLQIDFLMSDFFKNNKEEFEKSDNDLHYDHDAISSKLLAARMRPLKKAARELNTLVKNIY